MEAEIAPPAAPGQGDDTRQIRLLGPPRWAGLAPGGERALAAPDALLLAWLAMQGPQPRQRLAALLWPDSATGVARNSLRQRIFRLNRDAGSPWLAGDPLLALAPTARLDLRASDEQIAARLQADPQDLRGDLLAGVDLQPFGELGDWVLAWRQQWDQRRIAALHGLIEQAMAAGQPGLALLLARRLVEDNPCAEAAHRRLIELHYLAGERDQALAAYQRCEQALQQGLGLAPSPQTQAWLATLRAMAVPALPAQAPPACGPRHPTLSRPPRLIGRDAVWAQARAAWQQGQPALVIGEAGIGKTRLLTDLAAAAGGCLLVGARPGDADLPYALLARLVDLLWQRQAAPATEWAAAELGRVRPGAPQGGQAAAAQRLEPFTPLRLQAALRQALHDWCGASAGPPLAGLVMDDLHHADPASLDLLLPLVGDARTGLQGWLLATRPADGEVAAPAWAGDWPERGGLVLPLHPLGPDALQALAGSLQLPGLDLAALGPRLAQATGGNPLFLLQTLADLLDRGGTARIDDRQALPAPAAAVAVVQRRIALLDPLARQLLRLAAMAGPEFNAGLAADVLQQAPLAIAEAWQALQQAHLLRGADCAHDLVREAALRDLPEALAQATHRSIAQALTSAGAMPARRARHWQAGQAWLEAAQAWDAAAQAAAQRSASAEEIAALDRALHCLSQAQASPAGRGGPPDPLGFELTLRLAHALFRGGEPAAALARLQAIDGQAPTPALQARHGLLKAGVLADQGASGPALAAAQQAMALARSLGDSSLALQAAQRAAVALMGLGRADEGLALMPADPPALAALSADERLYWLCERALLLDHANQRQQALAAHDQVIAEAEQQQRWLPAAVACCNKSVALMVLCRLQESSTWAERGIELNRRAGVDDSGLLVDEMNLAGNWRDLGWFDRYLARAERLPDELRAVGFAMWAANAEHDLAVAYAWLGRIDLSRRLLLQPLPTDMAGVMQAMRLLIRIRLARDFDQRALAPQPARLLDQALAHLGPGTSRGGSVLQAIVLERALLLPPAEGVPMAAQVVQDALAQQNLMLTMAARRVQLLQLLAAGDRPAAAAVARPMLAQLQQAGASTGAYLPGLYWHLAQALADDAPAQAGQALAQAAAWIRRTAAEHVPELYRHSFLHRNPVNRMVLNAVAGPAGAQARVD